MSSRSTYYTALVGSCISAIAAAITFFIYYRLRDEPDSVLGSFAAVCAGFIALVGFACCVMVTVVIAIQRKRPVGESTMRTSDFDTRKEKARDLEVIPAGDAFLVKSSTRKGGYMVTPEDDGKFHCACMDYATHRSDSDWKCKHIIAVETYLELRPRNGTSRYDVIDIR